ncbi:TadE family type IV pilus minor pilin [Actinomadura syzygii]|uniref:TadE family type IV pilus minor pilin n=1 Tax=Actinomadura syzygii TaxID=1427538 RepID=UPI001FE6B6B7|nr:TadE family type IV pilus minor pilin [Actinomadura syzygii]
MVTAEVAVALPSLVLITAIALWGLALASVQLTCTDAARTGARAAARGESLDAVRELVVKAVPEGATVHVSRDQATVRVDVSASVKPPAAAGLATLTVHAHAVAATEPVTEPNANEAPLPTTPTNPVHPKPQPIPSIR